LMVRCRNHENGEELPDFEYHHAGGKKISSNYKSKDDRLGMGSGNRGNGIDPQPPLRIKTKLWGGFLLLWYKVDREEQRRRGML